MRTALDHLERVAERRGWQLRWKTEPLPEPSRLSITELDIVVGKKVISLSGPLAVLHGGAGDPRQRVAEMVLAALPRRSPPAVAAYGGRA